jgi:hypothetical protein
MIGRCPGAPSSAPRPHTSPPNWRPQLSSSVWALLKDLVFRVRVGSRDAGDRALDPGVPSSVSRTAAWATGSPRSMASPGDDPVLELVAGLGKAIPPACERGMHSRTNARKVIEVPGRPASCKSARPSPTSSRRPPTRFAEQTARENRSSTAPAHAERAEVGVAEPANPRNGRRHATCDGVARTARPRTLTAFATGAASRETQSTCG